MIDANRILAIRKKFGRKERGYTLRYVREWYGITLEELAGRAGLTKQAVSQFELGQTEPRLEREIAIHQAIHDAISHRLSKNPDPKGIYAGTLADLASRKE